MAAFGELFGSQKLRKDADEDEGTGERFEPGPLDLDAGVVRMAPRPRKQEREAQRDDD